MTLTADLRSQQVIVYMDVEAPDERGGRARATWLVSQLKDAPGTIQVESYARGARSPVTVPLSALREDRMAAIDAQGREPTRFRLVARRPMGVGRKAGGKSPGFIDTVLGLLTNFYESVVQVISPWQPKAPKLKRDAAVEVSVEETDAIPPSPPMEPIPADEAADAPDTGGEGHAVDRT